MKVAIIIKELCIRGGTHKQVLRLAEYFDRNLIDYCIYTEVYSLNKTYVGFGNLNIISLEENNSFDGLKKTYLKKMYNRLFLSRKKEKKLVDMISMDTDVVNVHDNGFTWLFYYLFKRPNTKIVWQINDLPKCYRGWESNRSTYSIVDTIDKVLFQRIANRVDRITVNVSKNKDRVRHYLKTDAELFYCGVDHNPNLEKHSFPENKKTYRILTTGVFFPRRNYETLIKAIAVINKEKSIVNLDIIGSMDRDPQYAKKIKQLIDDCEMNDSINVWGQVDDNTYNLLHNNADIFVFLNIDQSWGLAVFEAMSAGLPVIVSESVGAVELLHNKYDSIIVNPVDVEEVAHIILKVLSNKEEYESLSTNAWNAIKGYSWDNMYCKRVTKLFNEIISNYDE